MKEECKNFHKNVKSCNCTYEPCSRKGSCCECLVYHRNMGQLPACFFNKEFERGYDRSFANFVKMLKKERG
jgi:hypothetical protein